MKKYVNLLLLVICMELILPLPLYTQALSGSGVDPVRPLIFLVGLILISLLVALMLRSQVRERTRELELQAREMERQLGDLKERREPTGPVGTVMTELARQQQESLQMASKSVHSLSALLNEIFDISRIESGQLGLESIRFSLRKSLEATLENFALTAESHGVRMVVHIDTDVPDGLIGDPGRLRQVVASLLGHAVQATAEGQIGFYVEVQSAAEDQVCLHLTVRDGGAEIPRDRQEALLEYRTIGEMGRRAESPLSGLGLSIAVQLVRLMDGEIWMQSPAPPEGTVRGGNLFHVTLRFRRQPAANGSESEREPLNLTGLRVLVADACPSDRRSLEDILCLWEMNPTGVGSAIAARSAMDSARQEGNPFTVIILDANLPETDGFCLAAEITHSEHDPNTRIILLTSTAAPGDGRRCRDAGVAAYLPKPVDQSDLLHALTAVLRSSVRNDSEASLVTRHSIRESRRPLRVLLVENHLAKPKFIPRLLEKWGHRVSVSARSADVMSAMNDSDFDLILIDLQLPGPDDGIDLARRIRRSHPPGRSLRIIGITSDSTTDAQAENLFDGFISRPLRIDALYSITRVAAVDSSAAT